MKIFLYLTLIILLSTSINAQSYDTLSVEQVDPGCIHYTIADTSKPVVIHLFEADLSDPLIDVTVAIAKDSLNLGGETVSGISTRKISEWTQVLGAVNADFFGDNPYQAQNSIVRNGELIKAVNLNRSMIAFDDSNIPDIGKFRFEGKLVCEGDTLLLDAINSQDSTLAADLFSKYWRGPVPRYTNKVYYQFEYDGTIEPNKPEMITLIGLIDSDSITISSSNMLVLRLNASYGNFDSADNTVIELLPTFSGTTEGIRTMTGGLPGLFKEGKIKESYVGHEGLTSKGFLGNNPRTAIGYNKTRTKLFVAVVDGRQENYSMGMSIKELAEFMKSVGCYEALNFDGGGSSAMFVSDSLVNKPSDKTGERKVYNAFMIIAK